MKREGGSIGRLLQGGISSDVLVLGRRSAGDRSNVLSGTCPSSFQDDGVGNTPRSTGPGRGHACSHESAQEQEGKSVGAAVQYSAQSARKKQ